jgi:hypothetical protein
MDVGGADQGERDAAVGVGAPEGAGPDSGGGPSVTDGAQELAAGSSGEGIGFDTVHGVMTVFVRADSNPNTRRRERNNDVRSGCHAECKNAVTRVTTLAPRIRARPPDTPFLHPWGMSGSVGKPRPRLSPCDVPRYRNNVFAEAVFE